MIPNQVAITGAKVFDLESFISKLERSYATKLKLCGCPMPDQCSHDMVVDYFVKQNLRNTGRCTLYEGTILINFDGAESQEAVLRKFLNYELLGKLSRCRICPFANSCPIREEFEDNENEPRISGEVLSSPVNPEELLRQKETIELLLNDIPIAKHKTAFAWHVIGGLSHEEIGKRLRTSPSTIRKWFSRERGRLRRKFGSLFEQDLVGRERLAPSAASLAPGSGAKTHEFPTWSELSKVRRKART